MFLFFTDTGDFTNTINNDNLVKKMYINKMTIENEQQTFNEVIGDVKNKCMCN